VTNGKQVTCFLILAVLASDGLACAAPEAASPVSAKLAADGRSFTVTTPGLRGCQGGFSARIKIGDQKHVLSSAGGTAVGPVVHLTEATPYGQAEVSAMTLRFEKEQVDLYSVSAGCRACPACWRRPAFAISARGRSIS
jgi:outer membrane lipoprotein-sorting protein